MQDEPAAIDDVTDRSSRKRENEKGQGGRCLDQSYLDWSGVERDHPPGGAHALHEHANIRDNIGDKEIAKYGRAQRPPEAQRRSSRCVSHGAARRSMAMLLPLSGTRNHGREISPKSTMFEHFTLRLLYLSALLQIQAASRSGPAILAHAGPRWSSAGRLHGYWPGTERPGAEPNRCRPGVPCSARRGRSLPKSPEHRSA